jgi:hypothetical protein
MQRAKHELKNAVTEFMRSSAPGTLARHPPILCGVLQRLSAELALMATITPNRRRNDCARFFAAKMTAVNPSGFTRPRQPAQQQRGATCRQITTQVPTFPAAFVPFIGVRRFATGSLHAEGTCAAGSASYSRNSYAAFRKGRPTRMHCHIVGQCPCRGTDEECCVRAH